MSVPIAGLEGRAVARAERLFPAIGDEDQLALQYHDKLILMGVPVPLAGPDARRNSGEVDTEGG